VAQTLWPANWHQSFVKYLAKVKLCVYWRPPLASLSKYSANFPPENMPTFKRIHPLQVYCPCLHVVHWNTHVNGANFIVNCHKTRVNTLKSKYSIQTCTHSLIFGRVLTNFYSFIPGYSILQNRKVLSITSIKKDLTEWLKKRVSIHITVKINFTKVVEISDCG